MKIQPFKVEEWMNEYETGAKYNIAETCVDSISLKELFDMDGTDMSEYFQEFGKKRLTYGYIEGNPELLDGICSLYHTLKPENVVPTHGAAGANHHIFYSLVEPEDEVISIMPTYQQLYSIPESFGADVKILKLEQKDNYLPDLTRLREMVTSKTKMICINNPNNPTGALMSKDLLEGIVDIAREADIYILCDEVYRHLTQEDGWCESIADLYEKGISVSSMSKVFSLAGIRLGWIATHDRNVIKSCLSHRDYDLISCGMFDEVIGAVALRNKDKILHRNRTIIETNLKVLDQWVQSEEKLHYTKPQAGTTALIYYDYDMESYEFCKNLYDLTGAFVTPGDCFEEKRCFRVGYACSEKELKEGLKVFSEFLKKL